MLSCIFAVSALAAGLAAAAPATDNVPPLLCSTADRFCCSQFVDPDAISPAITAVLILAGINPDNIVNPLGFECASETLLGSARCSGTNVCCSGTKLPGDEIVLNCSDAVL